MTDTSGYLGHMTPFSEMSDYNGISLMISSILAQTNTASLVQVINVNASTVDVQPMVAQIDGYGNITPHGIIYGVPFVRVQGGVNAIIIDPQAGDIGIAVFAAQDISKVKATKALAPPGSRRKFAWADGVYFGGLLNAAPTQFVRFTNSGIEITSTAMVTITAPTTHVEGNFTVSGSVVAGGNVTGNGTSLHTHVHSGVTTGGGNTGAPV